MLGARLQQLTRQRCSLVSGPVSITQTVQANTITATLMYLSWHLGLLSTFRSVPEDSWCVVPGCPLQFQGHSCRLALETRLERKLKHDVQLELDDLPCLVPAVSFHQP